MRGSGDAPVLGRLIVGLALLGLFVGWQRWTRSPLVNPGLFRSARFSLSTLAYVVVGFVLAGALFIFTTLLQLMQGNDAQQTGIRLLPVIAASSRARSPATG